MAKQVKTKELRFVYYVEFLVIPQKIIHYFIVQACSNNIEVQFEMDNLNYEGLWCFHYLYFTDETELVVGLECPNQLQTKIFQSDLNCFQDLILIHGQNTQMLKGSTKKNLMLNTYPGKVKLYQITNILLLTEYKDDFFQGINEKLSINPLISYLKYSPFIKNNIISQFYYNRSYDIKFWSKINIKEVNQQQIGILKIKPHNFQQNLNIFLLNYIKDQEQWSYSIEYYTYNYPFVRNENLIKTFLKSFTQNIEVELITQWHLIEITYVLNILVFKLTSFMTNQKYNIEFKEIYQFSDILLEFQFGASDSQKVSYEGEIAQFNYFNYISPINQMNELGRQQNCHYSCQNCWGPFNNQCLSCLDSDNRIYDQKTNSCQCKLWYVEDNQSKCYGSADMNLKQTFNYLPDNNQYESEDTEIICAFGYFKYKESCIQWYQLLMQLSPSASQKGMLNCLECIQNPDLWVYKGSCQEQYHQFQGSQNNVYYSTLNEKAQTTQFFVVNEEVVGCDGCDRCTDQDIQERYIDCILYPDKHLDQDVYITCYFGVYQQDVKKCLEVQQESHNGKSQCSKTCGYCLFKQCLYCKDSQRYFMDVQGICRTCDLTNCKYCFQYNIFDKNQVSIQLEDISYNLEDYVIACSLCFPGYIFNFSINQCVEYTTSNQCVNGFISEENQFVCTSTLLSKDEIQRNIAIQFINCQHYYSNCLKCLQDFNGNIQCVECVYGYFLNFLNGICQQCSAQFEHSEVCVMTTSQQDNWKYQVQSFYINFKPNKIPILIQGIYYIQWYDILKCADGYIKFGMTCNKLINQDCLQYDTPSSICITCENSSDVNPILSYFDNQCQQCPYPCQICQPISLDQIQTINPYFIVNEQSIKQTYFCVFNYKEDLTYIESHTGQTKGKDSSKRRYKLQLEPETFTTLQNPIKQVDDLTNYLQKVKPDLYIYKYNSQSNSSPINHREQVFSLKNQTFLYDGYNDSLHQKQFEIANQSTVNIQNLRIFYQSNIFFVHSTFGVSIFFRNISISNLELEKTIFSIEQATNVYINTILLSNVTLLNSHLFSFKHYQRQSTQNIYIHIENIILVDSNLTNSSIISFYTLTDSEFAFLKLNQITVINTYLLNSSIITIDSITFNSYYSAERIIFKNSTIQKCILFRIPISKTVFISKFDIIECKISNSIFIKIVSSFSIQNIIIDNSAFVKSNLIIYTQQFVKNGYSHSISNLTLNALDFCGGDFISIKNDKDQKGFIKLQNLEIKNISSSCQNACNTSQCLFTYSSHTIVIENVQIKNIHAQWYFCLQKFTQITINNLIIQGNNLFTYSLMWSQIKQLKSSINTRVQSCGVFYIQDFVNIKVNNVQIKNHFIVNSALILLISKGQALNNQKININSLQLHNNYLIKTESTQFASLLYIYSEYFCETVINESSFKNNLIIHFLEDYSFISPGLIYIQVCQQNIYMDNNIIYQNTILNTTNSLIYLNSNQVKIKEIKVQNINYDPNQLNQDIYSKSIGGVIYAKTELFVIDNSVFQNLYGYQASCLFLELIRLGNVDMNNIYIENAISWSNEQDYAVGGCLGVNSINSKLNLNLNRIKIYNCKSKNQNGFLYLISSTISNDVVFDNIIFTNVFSQSKVMFEFDFSGNNQLNNVKLSNIIINLDETLHQQSFGKILEQTNQTRNGIISIFNSNIQIKNLYFEGIATQKILNLQFSNSILLSNLYLNQVNAKSDELITISNRGLILSENSFLKEILKIAITNITIYRSSFSGRSIDNFVSNAFLSIIIANIYQNQKIKLFLTKIYLIQNQCETCQQGLIYIQLDQNVEKCKISDFVLYDNNCGQSNCLFVNQSVNLEMRTSMLIQNIGKSNGTMKLDIDSFAGKNLLYLNNIGTFGGGLYYKSTNELTNLKNIQFINNSAELGGAVYIENTRISPVTLSKIFFIDNMARNLISNVREQPSHLQLSLFGQKIMTIRDINSGQPNFTKYDIDNFIQIPSGQKIGNYELQISNEVTLNKFYNIQLKILPINTLNEVQIENENAVCMLDLSNQMNKDNIVIYKDIQQQEQIAYNISSQSFDLSNHSIVLDPYSKEIEFQRFKVKCDCIRNMNYTFQFNAKSFTCKMGEYYFESQCLLCDYKKGFYSVELKAQNCQKVDPKLIKSNTINTIELYPGYWRPNIRSHYISKCQSKINNCLGGWQTGDISCQDGSIGALCEECDIYNFRGFGQYFKNKNIQCEICSEQAWEILFSLFINSIAIVSIYLTVISVNSVFKSFKLLKQTTKYYKIIFCSNLGNSNSDLLDQSAALIKMIVNYCQILVSIKSFQSDLYFNIIDILMPISNPIGSSTFSFQCYITSSSSIQIIYLTQIMYLMLPAIYYLFFLTSYLILVIGHKMILSSTIYFTALIYLFFYTQPNIIKQFGGLIAYRTISMIDYININTSYLYYTQEHQNWVRFFIGPVLVIFGGIIPLVLLAILYRFRKYFHFERTRKIWGYLFNDYKENSYYWEIIKIFQREVIMLSLIINEERVILKSVITLLVLILYFFSFLYFQPYNLQALNRFEQESILLCGIIIILSSLHYQSTLAEQGNLDIPLQILQIIFSLYFIYTIIKKVVLVYYTKYDERLDSIRKQILQKYPQIKYMCPGLKTILVLRSERKKIALSRFQLIKKALIQKRINTKSRMIHSTKVSQPSPLSVEIW
ncbi:unnamed protein product (macronuclear) [Paramecium tetraurelia]|uniref:Transmembrane protein n=1 Tax=Paramecium tetraurelia TaxID=5888 RepID=A0BZR7_PARTE|nr:uncharacterized protein GSPATT00005886001 [Paramecium tetraurelia]CAK64034.1 unnamed protein product [Paramecium tetraurelia]|eukprot:XP_001431432.1 hypothetical protein (macronuclear) [Paramecium tetraurelia strain d4-2]